MHRAIVTSMGKGQGLAVLERSVKSVNAIGDSHQGQ
jgi:hypothetical protein